MNNLKIIDSTNIDDIIKQIPFNAHFTNGTYAVRDNDFMIKTTLASFHYVNTINNLPNMVLAINSDKSMVALNKTDYETQSVRANKVAIPLAKKFPNHQIFVVYYNEETPYNLYESLQNKIDSTRTLHKWGYGLEDTSPRIEGAEFFNQVYAFPLPEDIKPVCYDNTREQENKPKNVVVVTQDEIQPYLDSQTDKYNTTQNFFTASKISVKEPDKQYALTTSESEKQGAYRTTP